MVNAFENMYHTGAANTMMMGNRKAHNNRVCVEINGLREAGPDFGGDEGDMEVTAIV
jgi:hypothetical protein